MLKRGLLMAAAIAAAISATAQFTTTPEQVREHVDFLAADSLLGRGFGTPQGRMAAGYIAGQLEEAGVEPLGGSYFHPFNYRKGILNIAGVNVAGVIPGSDPVLKEEYILLGAHFDHLGWKVERGDTVVFNGADDNASGTASIIEIGRNLAASRSSLGRSIIIVAFDGEESGLIGSTQFVRDTLVPIRQIRLMFSLDMVGMVKAHKGVDLVGAGLLDDHPFLESDLAGRYNLSITKSGSKIEQRTDTAPFGKAGIPAVHVFTGLESPYHKPEDEAGGLDYEGMASVASYMSDATLHLSSSERISEKMDVAKVGPMEGPKVFRAGIRVNAGTGNHNYVDRYYKGKSIFAAEGGLFLNIRAASFLNIQPEVLYETGGSQHEDGVFRTHSVTAPLNLQLITPEEGMVRAFFQMGGYYSYHFSGQISGTPVDFDNDFQDQEYGLTIGAGLEVMNTQWGICFQQGLSDLNRLPDDRIRQQTVYFSLGFIF